MHKYCTRALGPAGTPVSPVFSATLLKCRMYNLPVDVRMIRLDKGQHKQEEYLAINPLGKVGAIKGSLWDLLQTPPGWHLHPPTAGTLHCHTNSGDGNPVWVLNDCGWLQKRFDRAHRW